MAGGGLLPPKSRLKKPMLLTLWTQEFDDVQKTHLWDVEAGVGRKSCCLGSSMSGRRVLWHREAEWRYMDHDSDGEYATTSMIYQGQRPLRYSIYYRCY